MSDKDQWKKLRRQLEEQGCQLTIGNNTHYKVFRHKQLVATLPHSPGGGRGLRNKRAELKRKGFTV